MPAEGLCGPRLAHRPQSPEGTRPVHGMLAVVPEAASPTEGKLHDSKQPGVKTPLWVLPTTLCKTKKSLTQRKKIGH